MPGSQTQTHFNAHKPALRHRKGLSTLGVPSYYVFNKSYLVSGATGLQAPQVVGQWNSVPDVYSMGLVAQASAVAGSTPLKFHVRSMKAEMMFTNSAEISCVMDIYDIAAIKDVPTSASTGPSNNVSTPWNAWFTGNSNQITTALPSGITNGLYVPGALPQDSQLFKDYYKIVSKKTIALGAGASHQHLINLTVPRVIDLNESQTEAQYLAGSKGFTFYTMIVVRGQIGSGDLTSSQPLSQTSSTHVRCLTTERYEYQWLTYLGSLTTYSLGSQPTPGGSMLALGGVGWAATSAPMVA